MGSDLHSRPSEHRRLNFSGVIFQARDRLVWAILAGSGAASNNFRRNWQTLARHRPLLAVFLPILCRFQRRFGELDQFCDTGRLWGDFGHLVANLADSENISSDDPRVWPSLGRIQPIFDGQFLGGVGRPASSIHPKHNLSLDPTQSLIPEQVRRRHPEAQEPQYGPAGNLLPAPRRQIWAVFRPVPRRDPSEEGSSMSAPCQRPLF